MGSRWCVVGGAQDGSVSLVAASGVVMLDVLGHDDVCVSFAGDSIRSVHSARPVRTNLSAMAFMRGACGAVVATLILQAVNTASTAAVNLESGPGSDG